jgi:hypothetical protein
MANASYLISSFDFMKTLIKRQVRKWRNGEFDLIRASCSSVVSRKIRVLFLVIVSRPVRLITFLSSVVDSDVLK